nr:hypothetical protein [Acidimicrobiia bacterium]
WCGTEVLNVPGVDVDLLLVPDQHLGRFKVTRALNGSPRAQRVTDPAEVPYLRLYGGLWRIHTCLGSLAGAGGL